MFSNYQTHPVNFLHWLRVIFWLISNFCRHHPPPPSPHLGCGGRRSGGKCDSTFKVKMTQFFLSGGGGGGEGVDQSSVACSVADGIRRAAGLARSRRAPLRQRHLWKTLTHGVQPPSNEFNLPTKRNNRKKRYYVISVCYSSYRELFVVFF